MEGLEEGGDLVLINMHIHDIHTKIHAYIHTKGNKYITVDLNYQKAVVFNSNLGEE